MVKPGPNICMCCGCPKVEGAEEFFETECPGCGLDGHLECGFEGTYAPFSEVVVCIDCGTTD